MPGSTSQARKGFKRAHRFIGTLDAHSDSICCICRASQNLVILGLFIRGVRLGQFSQNHPLKFFLSMVSFGVVSLSSAGFPAMHSSEVIGKREV